jgi:1,2-phenylacetyl-CoA epoxidase PaaB subunit
VRSALKIQQNSFVARATALRVTILTSTQVHVMRYHDSAMGELKMRHNYVCKKRYLSLLCALEQTQIKFSDEFETSVLCY